MSETSGGDPVEPRRRGRHVAPPAADVRPFRVAAARASLARTAAATMTALRPRLMAATAWLRAQRLRVLVIATGIAVLALLGGTIALLQPAGTPQRPDDAAPAVGPSRPTSDDPAAPSTVAPGTTPTPSPLDEPPPADPVEDRPTDPVNEPEESPEPATEPEPTATPEPTSGTGRDTAPGQTKKPEKPAG
ncbi:hypothetical protein [Agromyces salentinus]|uniref:Uncharacterized protein n=1 Tax=Agromyces salentinus TaxID=269421 RepID=A0ABP4YRQ7_9MICO|nr:hypothetical protein [Agromyces salentinus]